MKTTFKIIVTLIFIIVTHKTKAQKNGEVYYIKSALGTYLDIKEANPSPRTPVWMWNKNGSSGQKWKLTSAGNGYFYIQSDLGTYLDIKEGKRGLRAMVWTWTLNKGNGQKWRFEPDGNGFYYICSALGNYLDIRGANPYTRAQVWMWSKNGSLGQKWKLISTGKHKPQIKNEFIKQGDYFIKSALGHRYLDVKETNSKTRAKVWMWFFSGGSGQKWLITPTGDNDNSYYIKSHLGTYLDIRGANASPRSEVLTWYKNESSGQKWYFEKANVKGKYYIKSKLGTYLDAKEANSKEGTIVWMWSLNKGKGQQWELVTPRETLARPNPKFTSFDVYKDGFNFENDFETIVDAGIAKFKLKGLCGGMAYAANDYFSYKMTVPATSSLPPNGSPLQKYIYERQQNSLANIDKFGELSFNPDGIRDEEFFYWGLEDRFYTTLKNSINKNRPIPLGLFNIYNDPTKHHQVLAIGYDFGGYREGRHWDPNKENVRIFIYDPNYSNEICALVPNTKENCYDEYSVTRIGNFYKLGSKKAKKWRTYFIDEKYNPKRPPRL
ncbi:RICIN domain-containing protein [Gelatiniphilus marinus]|uniref:RICIN domain-containing protein n=1 Tax=Gelatiniphilus marinus TaxID=1759464 RepID=A0ABW5JND5_9FLAO